MPRLTGRAAEINAAMEALARNIPATYDRYKINNGEAAAWLNNNRVKLHMFTPNWRKFLIDGLNEEIEDVGHKGSTSIENMNEIIAILSKQAPAAAPASNQTPAAAPVSKQTSAAALVSEPPGKQEATSELSKLIDKLMENNFALKAKAKHHLLFLSSEEQPPEKKRKEAKDLTELMTKNVNDRADRLLAMYYISILRGNEGGYRQRTKHSKKSRKTKSRKTKSRRH